jgi:hypothetical protein
MSLVTVNSRLPYKHNKPYTAQRLQTIVAEALTMSHFPLYALKPADIRVVLRQRDPDEFGFPSVSIDIMTNGYDHLVRTLPDRYEQLMQAIKESELFPATYHGPDAIKVWIHLSKAAVRQFY